MIPFLDLAPNSAALKRYLVALRTCLKKGRLILGKETENLESYFSKFCLKKYSVGVSSGTDALVLAFRLLGLKPGDQVITTPLSWIATSNAICLAGGIPVFIDIGNDLNIDPEKIERAITKKTKAICVVHFGGVPCKIDKICKIAKKNKLFLIEDAAQSFGSFFNGKPVGSFGDIACFSMNAMKVLNSLGDAGMVCVNLKKWKKRLEVLRYNGTSKKKYCYSISGNHRIDEIQAAFINRQIPFLKQKINKRSKNIDYFKNKLNKRIKFQETNGQESIAFYTCQIITKNRKKIIKNLLSKKIGFQIQHPLLIPQQKAYKKFAAFTKDKLTNAKKLVKEILCIPMHENLTKKEKDLVINSINHGA